MMWRGRGDRRYNDWHYTLARHFDYIDIDGADVCHQCRDVLLLTEVTRDPAKATTIIRKLATRAHLPSVLIILPDEPTILIDTTPIMWRWLTPTYARIHSGTLDEWTVEIERIHSDHTCGRARANDDDGWPFFLNR